MTKPIVDIKPTSLDRFLNNFTLVSLLTLILIPIYYWGELSNLIPTHYNFKGEANWTGPKEMIWILPVVGITLYFLLQRLIKAPHKFNYLVPITIENAEKQYSIAVLMMRLLLAFVLISLAYICWSTVQISLEKQTNLSAYFPLIFLIIIVVVSVYGIVASFRNKH